MNETIIFSTTMRLRDGIRYKLVNPKQSGRNKIALEGFNSYSFNRSQGKLVQHERAIDRGNDRYYELVSDPDTGEVIHRCEEKLSEHRGRGCAAEAQHNKLLNSDA